MMSISAFWDWYRAEAKPKLERREESMTKALAYLDTLPDPITIVETGCLRVPGNWGDGQSSLLFARYVEARGNGAAGYAVDLDPRATQICIQVVGRRLDVRTGDSIVMLPKIRREIAQLGRKVSLLYLDSYDVDFANPMPSAIHHMMEFAAMAPVLDAASLVLADDSPREVVGVHSGGGFTVFGPQRITGKAKLLADYAQRQGAELYIDTYQVGWIGLGA